MDKPTWCPLIECGLIDLHEDRAGNGWCVGYDPFDQSNDHIVFCNNASNASEIFMLKSRTDETEGMIAMLGRALNTVKEKQGK